FAGQVKAQTYSSNWFSADADPCLAGVSVEFVMHQRNSSVSFDDYWQGVNNYIQIKIGSGPWQDWIRLGSGTASGPLTYSNYSIYGQSLFCIETNLFPDATEISPNVTETNGLSKIRFAQQLPSSAQGQQISFQVKAGSYFGVGSPVSSFTFATFNGVQYNPVFAAPTSVTATPICNGVRLSWVNPALSCGGGSYYQDQIYINDVFSTVTQYSFDAITTSIDIIYGTQPTIYNGTHPFEPGQSYQFKIKRQYQKPFFGTLGYSEFTIPVSASINTVPAIIQNLQATTDLCRKVKLTWNEVSNCDSVKILIQYRPEFPFQELTTLSGYSTEYTLNSPTNLPGAYYAYGNSPANEIDPLIAFYGFIGGFNDIVYKFKVVGKNQCGWGAESGEVTGKPQKVPTQIARKRLTLEGNGVRLRWGSSPTDPCVGDIYNCPFDYTVKFETGFRIIRASSSGQIVEFVAPVDAVSFLDNTVVGCETYTYNVFPVNECAPNGYDCNWLDNSGQAPTIFAINYNPSVYAQYNLPESITTTPNISNVLTSNSFQASKGYYPNRVELSWTGNQLELIDLVRVFRKQLGSADAPVLIGSVAPSVGVFIDNFADAGTLYEYSIRAEKTCNASLIYSDILYTVGFRSPIATVNGSVTYSGGSAVEGVRISAESNSQINGAALELNGGNASIAHNAGLNPSNAALIEGWIKPNSLTSDFTWVSKPGQYEATYVSSSNQFSFKVFSPSTNYTLLSDAGLIQPNNYNHLAFQLRNDSLQIYVNGQLVNAQYTDAGITINPGVSAIIIGQGFNGLTDEVRIWNTSKSAKEIRQNYSRYLTGGEAGLKVYLKFDESNGSGAYDMSRVNSNYNKNNATLNGTQWSTSIPTSAQLSNAAYTNNLGNYTLVLPYNGVGESFTLSPSYLNHTPFLPASRVIYLGDGSFVQNNIDFVDQSSFTVTGSIFYAGTNCPAKDINIRVDGQLVVVAGEPVKTNSDGSFSVEVPIGQHYVDAYKEGHVFTVGRFPSAAGTTYNFQSDMQVNFTDNTLIKVIGRAVGGDREGNKMPTLSINNIGKTKVIFTSESGCAGDTLITDNITGEYVTYLPPLKYIISAEVISNPLINFGEQDLLDLTGSLPLQTDIVSENVNVNYNYKKNFIYHNVPEISVTDIDGVSPFIGDDELEFIDPATGQTQYRDLRIKPLRWPIFSSGDKEKIYKCLIKVYELYINADDTIKRDSVPSTNGRLYVSNQMADSYTIESEGNSQTGTTPSVLLSDVNNPDTLKSLVYSFKATRANFNVDANIPEYSYTQRIDISVIQEDGTIIPPWSLRAYNLGVQSVGNQYFTTGPDVVEYVLRDPPGNASFATREAGTTKTRSTTWGWNAGSSAYANDLILAGTKFTAGVGVLTSVSFEANFGAGFGFEISGGRNGEVSSIETRSTTLSTNLDSDIPGPRSDMYFGKSMNINIGITDNLILVPASLVSNSFDVISESIDPNTPTIEFDRMNLGISHGISIQPKGYETTFILSQAQIIEDKIPTLKNVRKLILQTNPKYTSNLPITDEKFGLNNDDPIFGADTSSNTPNVAEFRDMSGPSYTYLAENEADSLTGDSVRYLNNQIKAWEESIRMNEEEKVNITNAAYREQKKNAELTVLENKYQAVIIGAALAGVTVGAGNI
ncbi:MAG: LamG-like jellyroll fold domain-containing protein, partial [Bacteroidia bacterium]